MKQVGMIFIIMALVLTACSPKFEKQEEIVQESDEEKEQAIIPKYKISDEYYQTLLPFKPAKTRGLITGTVNNRFDIDELETGLMRIAQEHFSSDSYFFQGGQYLSEDLVLEWLSREQQNDGTTKGLNPPAAEEELELPEKNRKTPKYLSHILEHNYLKKNDEGKVELGGIVIGLSLNSVHYYQVPEYGWPRETQLDFEKVKEYGKQSAQEILERVRQMNGLDEVPVVVALFKEEPKESIVPGTYFAKAYVGANESTIKSWESINEKYYFFPSDEARDNHYEDAIRIQNFKEDIREYFPNYVGVVGKGFYKNDQLQRLTIKMPIQFFNKAEIIGFTEYVAGMVLDHFPPYISIEVYISTVDGPESIIVREAGEDEPFVHVYHK